jgi:hypothetical protein
MQGKTGRQTKMCRFKKLRGGKTVPRRAAGRLNSVISIDYNDSKGEVGEILFWTGNPVDPHIRPQYFRYHNGAVGLLVILDNGDPGAPNGET